MRIYVAQINPIVGHLDYNESKIIKSIEDARVQKADIVVFPELALCGYPAEDLLLFPKFIEDIETKLEHIIKASKGMMVIVGLPRKNPTDREKGLYNSAAVIVDGKLLGYKDKTLLPTYDIFDERRYFEPGGEQRIWEYKGCRIGVLICEDIWQHAGAVEETRYHRDPVMEMKEHKPDLMISVSASPYYFEKDDLRGDVFSKAAKTLKAPLIWCNQVGANDQLIFDGYSMFFNKKGDLERLAKGFAEDRLIVDTKASRTPVKFEIDPYQNLFQSLVLGIKDYFTKQGFTKACLGFSGGLDSAIVSYIAAEALGAKNVLAISMPSRFTSDQTKLDIESFLKNIPVQSMEVPIDALYQAFLDTLTPLFEGKPADTTEENLQARIRGMILMAISNKHGHIVLSPGNKSEASTGYSTLYGDLCGGLGVILDVSKTHLYGLANWINRYKEIIPESIITKPPSAELRENQKDQDELPEYSVLDAIFSDYVEDHLSIDDIVKKQGLEYPFVQGVVRKLHKAEYKRRQSPPAIRVTKKSFSKGRIFPIVQSWV